MSLKDYIEKCANGENLSTEEAGAALDLIMSGQATDAQVAGLLIALRAKGETVDEVVGFARTMRQHAVKIHVEDPDAVDLCGTGGDGWHSFNISTVASFVTAGVGVTVAKHGNRSVSSMTGSADLLTALGANIQLSPDRVGECVNRVGIGFLFAPLFHPAMKSAAKARTELGVRTIFNMLGPITNPAGVRKQLVGTYAPDVASTLAGALSQLHTQRACVVHSHDGMDEVTLAGNTTVYEVNGNHGLQQYAVSSEHFGLPHRPSEAMRGGNSKANAGIALSVLRGDRTPARDVVIANAAFGVYVSGKVKTLQEGAVRAAESIDSGNAMEKLERFIEYSNAA
jgi:anthranilate phosphoribosyltransferase